MAGFTANMVTSEGQFGVMRNVSRGGSNLGTASGRIVIDTSALANAVSASQSASKGIQSAFTGVDRSAQTTGTAVANSGRSIQSTFSSIRQGIKGMNADLALMATSATAGLAAAFGVSQAARLQRINALMRVFSGSQELAEQRLSSVRAMADRTGRSFLATAEGALAILPTVGRANVDLEKTLSIVQRLALLDPAQGMEGAAFAIRELLSGQGRSLAARFELPLTQINALLDSAGNDPQKLIDGLGRMVDQMGLTEEAFAELGQSGAYAFEQMQGSLQEAAAVGFTPFLQDVAQPLARSIADITNNIRESNPEILKWGAGMAVAVAALAPLKFIIGGITGAFAALAGVVTSPVFLTVLAALGALAAGVTAGTAIAQGLANLGIGDARMRSDSGENPFAVLLDRVKQSIVVLVAALYDGGIRLAAAFEVVRVQLAFAGEKLNLAFQELNARLTAALLNLVASIYELIPGQQEVAAGMRANAQTATNRADAVAGQREMLDTLEGLAFQAIRKGVAIARQQMQDDIIAPLVGFLYPAAPKANAGAIDTTTKGESADTRSILQRILDPFAAALGGATDAARDFANGARDINAEFDRQKQQLMQDRQIQDARQQFDYTLADTRAKRDFERQMSRSDTDFWRSIQKQTEGFWADLASSEAEALAQRAKANADFQEEETKRNEDHQLRLAEIQKNMMDQVTSAAFRLDATGVWEALKSGKDAMDKENSSYDRERIERQKAYDQMVADTKAAFEQAKDERIKAFAAQQADQIAQFTLQRERTLEDNAIRLQDEVEDRRIRFQREYEDRKLADDRAESDRQLRLFKLAYDLSTEAGLWSGLSAAAINAGAIIRQQIEAIFAPVAQTLPTPPPATYPSPAPAYPTPTPVPLPSPGGYVPLPAPGNFWKDGVYYPSPGGPGIPMYAKGGLIPPGLAWVGEDGPELIRVTQPTRIYNNGDSRRMAGQEQGSGASVVIENFAPVIGDIGQHSEARIIQIMEDALMGLVAEVEQKL